MPYGLSGWATSSLISDQAMQDARTQASFNRALCDGPPAVRAGPRLMQQCEQGRARPFCIVPVMHCRVPSSGPGTCGPDGDIARLSPKDAR
jgi:hypothetical protein